VACVFDENGAEVGTFATVGDVPNLSYQTLPLSASLYLPAGTDLQVLCSDYNSVTQTSGAVHRLRASCADRPRTASWLQAPAGRLATGPDTLGRWP
jgi:hypothetical protein